MSQHELGPAAGPSSAGPNAVTRRSYKPGLLLAGLFAAAAVALPWASYDIPGFALTMMMPISPPCAGTVCIDGMLFSTISMGEDETYYLAGTTQPIRVFVAAAVLLIWWGLRNADQNKIRIGWWTAFVGLVLGIGVGGVHAGEVAFVAALAVSALTLGVFTDRRSRPEVSTQLK